MLERSPRRSEFYFSGTEFGSSCSVQVAVSRDCRRDAPGGAHRKIVAESLAWASAEHWPIINPRRGEHAADLSRRVP